MTEISNDVTSITKPIPTVGSALARLKRTGLVIETVIDVGVQAGTPFLLEAFPDSKHHLLEPVDAYFETIRKNYQNIDYELHQVVVSSSSGVAFQVGVSIDNSSRVTHSYLSDENVTIGEKTNQGYVMQCESVRKVTLDDFFSGGLLTGSYLVKIDTDGHEMPVIQGGQATLAGADIVIIEAAMHSLLERANAIAALGFDLVEIVDPCYYHHLLSQVDLIFINKRVVNRHPDLRPWATKEFSYEQWHRFTHWPNSSG